MQVTRTICEAWKPLMRAVALAVAALGLGVAIPTCAEAGQAAGTLPRVAGDPGHRALHTCHLAGDLCGKHDPAAPGDDKRPDDQDSQAVNSAGVAAPANLVVSHSQSRPRAAPSGIVGPPLYVRNCAYLE